MDDPRILRVEKILQEYTQLSKSPHSDLTKLQVATIYLQLKWSLTSLEDKVRQLNRRMKTLLDPPKSSSSDTIEELKAELLSSLSLYESLLTKTKHALQDCADDMVLPLQCDSLSTLDLDLRFQELQKALGSTFDPELIDRALSRAEVYLDGINKRSDAQSD